MRILYHHRTLGDGAEGIHIREMVRAFRNLGHTVRVIGPVGERTPQASTRSKALSTVKRLIPAVLFEVAEIAYTAAAFVQTIWEIWRFKPDFIYDRYITFNAGSVLAGKFFGVPVLLEVNAPLALERSEQKDEKLHLRSIARAMERWICSNSSRSIVVSTPLKAYLESIGVPAGHCVVMANGVDPDRFTPRAKDRSICSTLGIPPGSFVIGFTGVLRAWHGLDLLIQAAAGLVRRNLDISVLIVGDGPYREVLERMASELGVGRRLFVTGRVPHEDVPRYIALFDVAVSPGATFYASPMKVVEYMALGKAVATPSTLNFLDMIDEGVNGVTFQEGSAIALEEVLARMVEDPQTCMRLGRMAREKVEARLNWQWNAQRCCEVIDQFIHR